MTVIQLLHTLAGWCSGRQASDYMIHLRPRFVPPRERNAWLPARPAARSFWQIAAKDERMPESKKQHGVSHGNQQVDEAKSANVGLPAATDECRAAGAKVQFDDAGCRRKTSQNVPWKQR